jgi:hypothetical protein
MMLRMIFGLVLVAQLAAGCGSDPEAVGSGGVAGLGGAAGMGGMPVDPGPACIAFCSNFIGTCAAIDLQTEAQCQAACQGTIEDGRATSEVCAEAYELGFQCVAGLPCAQVYAWRDRLANPCQSANAAIEAACP